MGANGKVLIAILSLLSLLWLPSEALLASGQPRLPQSSIPADASAEVKNHLFRLYSPSADKKAQAIAALGALGEESAPAVPFLIGMADCCSTEGKEIKQALVKIGGGAVEPLLPALRDQDRQVRTAAVWVLGELKDPRAVAALADLLRDDERMVREEAAKALGVIGDASAIGPLFLALHDKEDMLRQYAAKSLGKIGTPVLAPAIDLLRDPDVDQRRYAAWILGDLKDSRAVEPITSALRKHTDDATDRDIYETVMALAKHGPPATESLLALAQHGSNAVRREALFALGTMKDPRAAPLFLEALHDPNYRILAKAIEALEKSKDPRAVEPLIPILRDHRPGFRIAAAQALGAIGDGRAVEPLTITLKDSEGLVRMTAARALGEIKDPRAVEPLLGALKDRMSDVREEAAKALVELPDPRAVKSLIAALGDQSSDVQRQAIEALLRIGAPAFDPLLTAVQDPSEEVRRGAVQALGVFKDPRAVEPLIPALKDSSLKYGAAYALGEIGDPRAAEPLLAALQDSPASRTVVAALVKLKDPRSAEPLVAFLEKSYEMNSGTAREMAKELSSLGEILLEPLGTAIVRSKSQARLLMADLLGDLKDPRAVAPLITVLRAQDMTLQEHVAQALLKIGPPAVEPLISAVKGTEGLPLLQNAWAMNKALWTLGELKDARGVEPLTDWFEKNTTGQSADFYFSSRAAALGKIGGPEACRFLVASLRDRFDRPGCNLEIGTLADALDQAACLPTEELLGRLRTFGSNLWTAEALQRSALEFLKNSGDLEAASTLARYRSLVGEARKPAYSINSIAEARQVLTDPRLPLWLKEQVMAYIVWNLQAAKTDLLDLCLGLAALEYAQQTDLLVGRSNPKAWGAAIGSGSQKASGSPEEVREFLEQRRRSYREEMTAAAFARQEALIDHVLNLTQRASAQQEVDKLTAATRPTANSPPAVKREAPVPPPGQVMIPPGIQTQPFAEPEFSSLGSRLIGAELFLFDEGEKWFGLGRADLFLAAVMKRAAETTERSEKEEAHLMALNVMLIERKLADETSRRLPLLLPLPFEHPVATTNLEWSLRSRDCTVALEVGRRHLVLFRSFEKTVVRFRLNPPLSAGGSARSAAALFEMNDLPAKAWVIAEYGPAFLPPVVFLSFTGVSLDRRFHLLHDERQQEVPLLKDEGEARLLARFLATRKALESYENESFAKAGGPFGVAAFRNQLLVELEERRRRAR